MARLQQPETSYGGGGPHLTHACNVELQPHCCRRGMDYQADPTIGIGERARIVPLCTGNEQRFGHVSPSCGCNNTWFPSVCNGGPTTLYMHVLLNYYLCRLLD